MKLIKSILKDFTSISQILLNNWHLHAIIGFLGGVLIYFIIGGTITDTWIVSQTFLKLFVPTFLGGLLCWGFERWQQLKFYDGLLNESQGFESDKDCIVSCIFVFLGVLTGFFIF